MAQQTSVMTLASRRVDNNEELLRVIDQYKSQTINLVPDTMSFGARPELQLGFTLVKVNTDFGTYQYNGKTYTEKSNGDIYLVDNKSKKYALHLRKLKEVAQAAGVKIISSKLIDYKQDEDGRFIYAKHEIKWQKIDIDGSTKEGTVTGDYTLAAQKEKYKDQNGNVNESVVNRQQGDALKLAESNAYGRAIRDALPKMPATFTLEELKKPILIPCVIKDISKLLAKHPDIEEALLAKELGVSDFLFTKRNQQQLTEAIPTETEPEQPKGSEPEETPYTEIPEAGQPETTSEPTSKERNKIIAKEFKDQPQAVRTKKINELIKETGYKRKSNTPIADLPVNKQIEVIEMLLNLKDEQNGGEF